MVLFVESTEVAYGERVHRGVIVTRECTVYFSLTSQRHRGVVSFEEFTEVTYGERVHRGIIVTREKVEIFVMATSRTMFV